MENPAEVVNTIIDGSQKTGKVYPITIRRYALLEKLNSPFLNPEIGFDVNSIIPSAFVVCNDNQVLKKYTTASVEQLISDAFDWAEGYELSDMPDIVKAITSQLQAMNSVAPEKQEKPTEKKTTEDVK